MILKDKIDFIIKTLDQIYPEVPIPLNHKDPYTLLIAVLLSAQSTDVRVNQITPILFKKADNPFEMIKLKISEIKSIIKPIGLSNTKSNGIYNLSKIIINKHSGNVPNNFKDLEALPSVGHKTASVVLSQAFGIETFPVDTHIHRMMNRWGLSNGKNVIKTENDAKRIFPKNKWNILHLQIIMYAREFSPARGWDIENDIITKTIGRRSIINKLMKK
ncbi:MAG: endonuclease III [Flavobacteriaceae bacterium]|nr:endonuclease III [Flavobacteriaceae bacterium]